MGQMQTISIRLPDDDFQWLLSLQEQGARTPSEKLRALLAKTRQQESGLNNPELCSTWMRGLAQPFVESVAARERKTKSHSNIVSTVAEWTPQIMATLVSTRVGDNQIDRDAVEVEAVLTQQCFQLLSALLRTAVTSSPPVYDKNVLDRHLPDIIELANIISSRRGKELQNG